MWTMEVRPLNFRRWRESIPRGRRHDVAPPRFCIFTNSSDWWRGKCSVRFLTIFLCGSGVGAMAMAAQKTE